MNTVEKLLKLDAEKLQIPGKTITMTPAKLGVELEFPCVAIHPEKYSEIQEKSYEISTDGDFNINHTGRMKILTIIEGCPSVFKDQELRKHFGCPTPAELVSKLLLSGEIDDLYGAISELNGYKSPKSKGKTIEEEIKN